MANVFVNRDAVPRAMVARRVVAVADERAALERIGEAGFTPRTDVVVERDQPGAAALAGGAGGSGQVAVVHETSSTVTTA